VEHITAYLTMNMSNDADVDFDLFGHITWQVELAMILRIWVNLKVQKNSSICYLKSYAYIIFLT